jgi:pyridinium-3,5-bisthiocarboxylic acid mononucleotide nickel chelatase
MKIVYLDCIGGASGDMLLSALADVGVPQEVLRGVVSALRLPGCDLRFERVMKGPLTATQVSVDTPRQEEHRHLSNLLDIVHQADLPEAVRAKTETALRRIAQVEAGIHNEPIENVHLHEVGGDDTLIDIAGALVGLDWLGAGLVVVSPLPLGRGFVRSAHGQLPLPAPATLALLTGVPIRYVDIESELVTPTGAAILTTVADRFGGFPPLTLHKVGVGAGRRDLPFPNVIRLWLGETPPMDGLTIESLDILETNIDDMNPQIFAYVMERLFAAGALDVTFTPQQMKKNRPAVLISVLCRPELDETLIRILFEETTTLGVRRQTMERICMPRAFEIIETVYGPIHVKVARWSGIEHRMPEYEDCRKAAEAYKVPLAEVMQEAKKG